MQNSPTFNPRWGTYQIETIKLATIKTVPRFFTWGLTALCCCQLTRIGPKRRWACNQACKRGLALIKQALASNTKGVVGNKGRNKPIMPSTKLRRPHTFNSIRRTIFLIRWYCISSKHDYGTFHALIHNISAKKQLSRIYLLCHFFGLCAT